LFPAEETGQAHSSGFKGRGDRKGGLWPPLLARGLSFTTSPNTGGGACMLGCSFPPPSPFLASRRPTLSPSNSTPPHGQGGREGRCGVGPHSFRRRLWKERQSKTKNLGGPGTNLQGRQKIGRGLRRRWIGFRPHFLHARCSDPRDAPESRKRGSAFPGGPFLGGPKGAGDICRSWPWPWRLLKGFA